MFVLSDSPKTREDWHHSWYIFNNGKIMQEKVFRRMDVFYDLLYQWSILKKIQVIKCWKHTLVVFILHFTFWYCVPAFIYASFNVIPIIFIDFKIMFWSYTCKTKSQ